MPFDTMGTRGPLMGVAADVSALGAILRGLGFVPEVLMKVGLMARRGQQGLPYFEQLRRCAGGGDLERMCRLFVLNCVEEAGAVDRALRPLGIGPLLECGLLEREGEGVRARLGLLPIGELLIASDFSPLTTGRPNAPDMVLPVGSASVLAANLAVRREGETMLDLGTGQGIQMIMGRRHAARVIGTDVNERALNVAAFNLALNGAAGARGACELRMGSFFEPVEAERGGLDLIVSNPPFVITPAKAVVGFTSALRGDGAVETIVRGAPAYLREGGWCVTLASWHHRDSEDWAMRPRGWIEGSGCDAMVVRMQTYHPRSYTIKWIEETRPGEAVTEASVDEWVTMLESVGAGAVSFGFVVMRKRAGRNWTASETMEYDPHTGPAGSQIARMFAGRTKVQECDVSGGGPERVLDVPLRVTPGVRVASHRELHVGGWRELATVVTQVPGVQLPVSGDDVLSQLVAGCDGVMTGRTILRRILQRGSFDEVEGMRQGAQLVRLLLERGVLEAA